MSNGRLPEEIVDAVLKHHDIVDVVKKYVHLTKQGKNFKGLCPFHSEKTPSFTVTADKQIFYCFGCSAGGNAIKFVMEMEGLSFPEAVRSMAEEADIRFDWQEQPSEPTEQQKDRASLLKAHEIAAKLYHYLLKNTDHGKPAMDYLKSRGFSDKLIDTFQIGYAPSNWDTLAQFLQQRGYALPLMEQGGLISARSNGNGYVDRFRDRIMFPIHDVKGNVIAFGGRILGDGQPKYLNTSETVLFNKSRNMYNFHQARGAIRKSQTVVLFEGYVDVIKAWEAGVLSGVATMGTSLTEHHAHVIKQNAQHVIVCYDGDNAGQTAAEKSIPILESAGCGVSIAVIPSRMDPDEYIQAYGAERFMSEIIGSAVSSTKFKLIFLARNHTLQDDEGRLKYIQAALKIIAEIPSPIEREHYLKDLSTEYHYSLDALKQDLHQIREQMQKVKSYGDNKDNSWNNVMNDRRAPDRAPTLFPAYHNAERKLLAAMIGDREVTFYVEQQLGAQFNVEAHAAIAAYLYAYYAQGNDPEPSRFIATLQDNRLESAASSISMTESSSGLNQQVLDDYIREIKKFPRQMEIDRKKEEMNRAERSGDVMRAVQIASEIITLERQMK
jgi:DNA primase